MIKDIKKYKGYSLVEMLLTLMILAVVMLLVTTTLNTVIKASHTANSKNLARSDVNYIMDIFSKLLTNAEIGNVRVYESSQVRGFGFFNGKPAILTPVNLGDTYLDGTPADGQLYNEVHIKLFGFDKWTCIGYFEDLTATCDEAGELPCGYIVKANSELADDHHEDCFAQDSSITILHSFSVDVSDFSMSYVDIGDEENSMFIINTEVTPLYWPVSDSFPVTRGVSRQLVISTKALTR